MHVYQLKSFGLLVILNALLLVLRKRIVHSVNTLEIEWERYWTTKLKLRNTAKLETMVNGGTQLLATMQQIKLHARIHLPLTCPKTLCGNKGLFILELQCQNGRSTATLHHARRTVFLPMSYSNNSDVSFKCQTVLHLPQSKTL